MAGQLKLNKVAVISGIWKVEPSGRNPTQKAVTNKGLYDNYLEVNCLEYEEEIPDRSNLQLSFKHSYKDVINHSLAICPISFYFLVGSFCPSIPGQELAKTCLLLTLAGASAPEKVFGHSSSEESPLSKSFFRENLHLLFLGERGIAKTEMLRYIEKLSPQSRICSQDNYFEGKVADSQRLTSRVIRDHAGEVQVNPGLLPLSHRGVIAIENLEKIDHIQPALVEVIERQKLSVAKKGGFEEFDCDCTIIGSAQPRSNKLK